MEHIATLMQFLPTTTTTTTPTLQYCFALWVFFLWLAHARPATLSFDADAEKNLSHLHARGV